MRKLNKTEGFTLIETAIYIGLFAIIIGGLLTTAFALFENAGDTTLKVTREEEINFVSKKIEWALTGIADVSVPASTQLRTTKNNFSPNPIRIRFNSTDKTLEYCAGSCSAPLDYSSLTTKNTQVEDAQFLYNSSTKIFTASLTIDGLSVNLTKFLKI